MIKWWNSRKQNTKLVVIGTILIPLLGICVGFCGVIVGGGNLSYLIGLPRQLSQENASPSIPTFVFRQPSDLSGQYGDELVYIIPPNCWGYDGSLNRPAWGDYLSSELYFVVLTPKKIVITDISVVLHSYKAFPANVQLTDYVMDESVGSGYPVEDIHLGTMNIFPDQQVFRPTFTESIEIPEADESAFRIDAHFQQPGEYEFYVGVIAHDYYGNAYELASEPQRLSWVSYPDLSKLSERFQPC